MLHFAGFGPLDQTLIILKVDETHNEWIIKADDDFEKCTFIHLFLVFEKIVKQFK